MASSAFCSWKAEVKRVATEKGVWRQFVSERDRLQKMGQTTLESWVGAAGIVDPALVESVPQHQAGLMTKNAAKRVKKKKADLDAGFERARASTRDVIQWVADYLGRGRGERKWLSPTAKALCEWCEEHPQNKGEFWRSMFSRLLPNRAQAEQDEAMGGDQLDGALAAIEEVLGKGAQGVSDEEGVGSS